MFTQRSITSNFLECFSLLPSPPGSNTFLVFFWEIGDCFLFPRNSQGRAFETRSFFTLILLEILSADRGLFLSLGRHREIDRRRGAFGPDWSRCAHGPYDYPTPAPSVACVMTRMWNAPRRDEHLMIRNRTGLTHTDMRNWTSIHPIHIWSTGISNMIHHRFIWIPC